MIGRRKPDKIEIFIGDAYFGGAKMSTFRGVFSKNPRPNLLRLQILIELDEFYQKMPKNMVYQLWNTGGVRICTGCAELSDNYSGNSDTNNWDLC